MTSTQYILIAICFVAVVLIAWKTQSHKEKAVEKKVYSYLAKTSPMTDVESEFFFKLDRIVADKYYVFPQVHLSTILDHHVDGQTWKYAFRHINGKSVDYVLCDRETLHPMYAIELDDYTHERSDRRERDVEVERIFEQVNIPLVRFGNKDILDEEIVQAFVDAHDSASGK